MALYGLSLGLHIPCRSRVNLHLRCGIYWLGRVHSVVRGQPFPKTRPYAVLQGRPWKKPTLRLHACSGGHLVDGAPPVFLICFVCSFVKHSKFSKISLISKRMLQPSNVCGKSHNFLLPQRNRPGKMRRLHFHHLLLPQRLCTRNRCGKLKTLFRKDYTFTIFCCRSCCVPGVDGAS